MVLALFLLLLVLPFFVVFVYILIIVGASHTPEHAPQTRAVIDKPSELLLITSAPHSQQTRHWKHTHTVYQGGVVYRQKKGGRKRAVSPQCEVRLKMATAEPACGRPNHRKSYAMLCGWATWGRFLCFLRGSGRFGSTVTYISGSTGYLTSETN